MTTNMFLTGRNNFFNTKNCLKIMVIDIGDEIRLVIIFSYISGIYLEQFGVTFEISHINVNEFFYLNQWCEKWGSRVHAPLANFKQTGA